MNLSSLTIANGEANLELLNKACTKFASLNGDDPDYQNINDALIKFCERPDSFNFCFPIINGEYHTYTKFLAYQIVKNTIMEKWNAFIDDDKENIRSSILISIVQMVKEGQKYSTISMATQSLIEVLKFDWPEKWISFIEELTTTCQNEGIQFLKTGLDILKMLAEEVSSNLASDDFSLNRLTKDRQRSMQAGIIKEFQVIYALIESAFNLKDSEDQFDKADIIEIDTKALDAFNSFIPIIGSEQLLESPFLSNVAPLISDDRFVFNVFSIFGRLCEHIAKTDTDHSVAKQLEKSLFPVFQMSIQQIFTNYGENINFNCVKSKDIQVLIQSVYEFLNLFISVLNLSDYQAEILVAVEWIIQASKSGLYTNNKDDLVFSEIIKFWHFFSTMLLQSTSKEESQFQEIFSSSLSQVIPFLVKNIVSPYSIVEISSESGGHTQNAVSTNSYESSLYDSMKETFVILYGLKKEDMINAISAEVDLLQKEEYDCDTINSVCWTVGSIAKAALDDENSELMGAIIPILVSIIENDNPSNDPTFEEIQMTASQDLLFLCSQEAKYFKANPDFLSSLVQIILKFVTEDSSVLNTVAIHSLNLLSKSCKSTFITPIQPSNGTILDDILKVFSDTVSNIRPDNLNSYVSIVADIVRFAQSTSKEESFIPVFDSFFDQVSTIINQSCSQIDEDLKRFQFLNQGADEGIKNFSNPDNLTLSIDYSYQQPELASIENIKSVINSINILNAIPTSMHALFLPFFEIIWPKLMNIYDFATNNSNMISTTDFDEKHDQSVSRLAHSSLELYNELSNLIANLFSNTLKILNNSQPQFVQVVTSSFYLGLSYHSLNPKCYPPNILALYGSLFHYAFNFDISDQQTYQAMVKMFLEVYESIFLPTVEVIKDEYDTFYELRVEMLKLIRGVIRGRPDLIFELTEEQIDIFIQMLMWLTKHPYEQISINATEACYMLINSFKASSRIKDKSIVKSFWEHFFMVFVSQMLELLSDSTYKFGFDTQTIVLSSLFNLPIALEQIDPIHNQFVQVFDKESTVDFVRDLLAKSTSLIEFRSTMKDLLIATKHYSEKDPDLCRLEIFQKRRMDELEKSKALQFGETEKSNSKISPEQVEDEVSIISDIFSGMTL